ncbi:outer membrane beta-barrel protein [Candidatus Symbiothrix dinenymphae]|uniref:outer membrane beta-barrel protein n=1 Tax=Candidatus Symbiothrix dinenymphae TaxID=467085 RepID=UPI0006C4C912|nr:outer membrane beta-barrel protein [Candidatus Symbiothrix dinenymphae]GAP73437.1 hypothetical protein SAMD00024442_9_44 [Candidatus Symbiothrix dinenymphae]
MKKKFLSLLLAAVCGVSVNAQKGEKAFGLNFGYGTGEYFGSLSVGAKFNYGITDHVRVSPSYNYFLGDGVMSAYDINADVHFLFNATDKLAIYPLAGVVFRNWTVSAGGVSVSEPITGISLGAGADFALTDVLSLGLEAKLNIASEPYELFVPAIHILYKF